MLDGIGSLFARGNATGKDDAAAHDVLMAPLFEKIGHLPVERDFFPQKLMGHECAGAACAGRRGRARAVDRGAMPAAAGDALDTLIIGRLR